jgi:transglutaminase-like putative cysteine protease
MQEKQTSVDIPPNLPPGLNPFRHISISSFESWGAVAREFVKLWKRSEKPGDLLPVELASLKESHADDPVELIGAVVAFVRDNIRYQGVETGRLGLVPDELHLIWERRFGDCKEKTSILCWMLRECGFEATPALVSTMMRGDGSLDRSHRYLAAGSAAGLDESALRKGFAHLPR